MRSGNNIIQGMPVNDNSGIMMLNNQTGDNFRASDLNNPVNPIEAQANINRRKERRKYARGQSEADGDVN